MSNSRRLKTYLLLLGDLVIFYGSLLLSLVIRRGPGSANIQVHLHLLPFTIVLLIWLAVFYAAGLYDVRQSQRGWDLGNLVVRTLTIAGLLAAAFFYVLGGLFFDIKPITVLVLDVAIFGLLFFLWRNSLTLFLSWENLARPVIFVGGDKQRDELITEIKSKPQLGFRTVAILEENDPILSQGEFVKFCAKHNTDTIVVAPKLLQNTDILAALYECVPLQVRFIDLASFYEEAVYKIPIDSIGQMWFLEKIGVYRRHIYDSVKRLVDVVLGLILGLIALTLSPFIALAIKLDSQGPVVFKQTRVGEGNKVILINKFRTMISDAEKDGTPVWSKVGDDRITKVGSFLRKTRLDELPQLWNILKGDLSFVGPRPERPEFVEQLKLKIPFYGERHLVKPGLTGWAQISLPYDASEEYSREKLQYDLYYIKNRGALLDLGIILKTAKSVLSRAGR